MEEKIRTVLINKKLWDVYDTHSKVIKDIIKEMIYIEEVISIDIKEIKISVEDTEILITRDDDNINVDIIEDGEALGGEFELLGVFDPSEYPYFFPAFEWEGKYYEADAFIALLQDDICEIILNKFAPCSATKFVQEYYEEVKNTEYANIFEDLSNYPMWKWKKDD